MPDPTRSHCFRSAVWTATVMVAVPVAVGWYSWADWVPNEVIVGLRGASKADLRRLLGEPTHVQTQDGHERWAYRRPLRFAEFRIHFSDAGNASGWSYDR